MTTITITQTIEPKSYTLVLNNESPFKTSLKNAIQQLIDSGALNSMQTADLHKWIDWYFKEKCGDETPLVLLILDGIDPLLEMEDETKQFLLLDIRDQIAALLSDFGKAVLSVSVRARSRDKAVGELFEEVRQGLIALQAKRRECMHELDERIALLIERLKTMGEKLKTSGENASAVADEIVASKHALKMIAKECHELLNSIR